MKTLAVAVIALCSVTFAGTPAGAQSYPAKPIRIVVPFPPGGTSDILSRLLGPKLTEKWGQPVVVENRPGAAGSIGAEVVARAQPDGYTLLLSDVGSLLIYQILFPKWPYDLTRNHAAVTTVSYSPHLLCVHPSVPVATIPQLVALAKKRPGALNYASSPAGTPQEITARLHAELARILSTPEIRERLSNQGADALATPPAEAAKFLRDERDRFTKLTKETGYKPQ